MWGGLNFVVDVFVCVCVRGFVRSTELRKFMGKHLKVSRSEGGGQLNKKQDVFHALPYP